ncbi:MAG: hypothetical protein IPH13_13975 [Planctomycetes bacterium]|nr:hypothetical protein [Planctomycetota bacterium]
MQVFGRLRLLMIVFAAAFAAVEVRLVHLQFRTREFWQKEALEARTDVRTVNAARGDLLDCWGRPLAVSRPQHTLSFAYGPFRQNTPIGQIRAASRILGLLPAYRDGLPSVSSILANPIEWARLVLERSDTDLAELPNQLRRDYGFYVRRLLARSESQFTKAKSERSAPNLPYFTITGEDREVVLARIVDAVSAQRAALAELARTAEQGDDVLIARVDEVIAKLEGEVLRAMEIGGIQPGAKQEALIRRDLEYRARELFRDVEFSAVFAVNLAPDVYAGFEVHDEERRFYPPETEDICPILVGKVNDPPEFLVKQTEERRARLLQLQSLPPEQMDQDTVLEIDRLRSMIRETDYLPDEEMGGLGLEALLESQLRGKRGWRYVETDSSGQDQTLLSSEPPLRGANVRITLDSRLQAAAERVLAKKNWPGAIVLLDPTDGAIRAMATWPCPTRKQLREDYAELTKDPRAPLFHRVYQSPKNPPAPGSVFKIITTAAALEAHTIGTGHVFDCEKSITRGRTTLNCLFHHGPLPLDTAFQKSCNVYYYKLGEAVGIEPIVAMAKRLGLGRATGFGDPKFLELPDPSTSLREIDCAIKLTNTEKKSITNTMRSAIGQATFDDTTPLQIAAMIAPFANGGNVVRPYLIDVIGETKAPREAPKSAGLSRSTIDTIAHAMTLVCEQGGTAGPDPNELRDLRPYRVSGKTGTAQVAKPDGTLDKTHAWFAGIVPHDAPKLLFAVFLENIGEHGGDVAAPLFNRLLEQPEMLEFLDMDPVAPPAGPPTGPKKAASKDSKPKSGASRDPRKER